MFHFQHMRRTACSPNICLAFFHCKLKRAFTAGRTVAGKLGTRCIWKTTTIRASISRTAARRYRVESERCWLRRIFFSRAPVFYQDRRSA